MIDLCILSAIRFAILHIVRRESPHAMAISLKDLPSMHRMWMYRSSVSVNNASRSIRSYSPRSIVLSHSLTAFRSAFMIITSFLSLLMMFVSKFLLIFLIQCHHLNLQQEVLLHLPISYTLSIDIRIRWLLRTAWTVCLLAYRGRPNRAP